MSERSKFIAKRSNFATFFVMNYTFFVDSIFVLPFIVFILQNRLSIFFDLLPFIHEVIVIS